MDFLTLATKRYSVRQLESRPVEKEKIDKIIEAARVAPTAVNFQAFKIWVIESKEAKEKLATACKFPFVTGAPVVFVVGGDRQKSWKRGADGYDFVDVDTAIAATHMMLEIHDLGLGTTWVGRFDPAKLAEQFPQMAGYSLIRIFGVGYPTADSQPTAGWHDKYKDTEELAEFL